MSSGANHGTSRSRDTAGKGKVVLASPRFPEEAEVSPEAAVGAVVTADPAEEDEPACPSTKESLWAGRQEAPGGSGNWGRRGQTGWGGARPRAEADKYKPCFVLCRNNETSIGENV